MIGGERAEMGMTGFERKEGIRIDEIAVDLFSIIMVGIMFFRPIIPLKIIRSRSQYYDCSGSRCEARVYTPTIQKKISTFKSSIENHDFATSYVMMYNNTFFSFLFLIRHSVWEAETNPRDGRERGVSPNSRTS